MVRQIGRIPVQTRSYGTRFDIIFQACKGSPQTPQFQINFSARRRHPAPTRLTKAGMSAPLQFPTSAPLQFPTSAPLQFPTSVPLQFPTSASAGIFPKFNYGEFATIKKKHTRTPLPQPHFCRDPPPRPPIYPRPPSNASHLSLLPNKIIFPNSRLLRNLYRFANSPHNEINPT